MSSPPTRHAPGHYEPADPGPPREFTLRAIATGMVIGGLLSLCNLYSGLKIGWSFNMSITAALVSFAFWHALGRLGHGSRGTPSWGILENNINQTAASAAASAPMAGLVAPIPAIALMTGQSLSWPALAAWIFSICLAGIVVALLVRRQMIVVEKLSFALGVATAETLREMYARGAEALGRARALFGAALLAAAVKLGLALGWIVRAGPTITLGGLSGGLVKGPLAAKATLANLTFGLDPSLMMVGVGGLIGMRACLSIVAGSVVAWGILAPWVVDQGWVEITNRAAGAVWYRPLLAWLVWPGVALMVSAALTSVAFSWRSIGGALGRVLPAGPGSDDRRALPAAVSLLLLAAVVFLAALGQVALFGLSPGPAGLASLLALLVAVVAARVAGETGLTPSGPLAKVSQLMFGSLAPGRPTVNLAAANVAAGAASQCADMMHDFKTGHLLGASARLQVLAQMLGALAGCCVASFAYLILIPDPANQLLTAQWPAPAVATWKAVAEVFAGGLGTLPPGCAVAMGPACAAGITLMVLEKLRPTARRYLPSAASLGLAFVIPVWISLGLLAGGTAVRLGHRWASTWTRCFAVAIAAGLIAGESLMGVGQALVRILAGGD